MAETAESAASAAAVDFPAPRAGLYAISASFRFAAGTRALRIPTGIADVETLCAAVGQRVKINSPELFLGLLTTVEIEESTDCVLLAVAPYGSAADPGTSAWPGSAQRRSPARERGYI